MSLQVSPRAPARDATFRFRARRRARRAFRSPSAPARPRRRALPARARGRRREARPGRGAARSEGGTQLRRGRTPGRARLALQRQGLELRGRRSEPAAAREAPAETQISSSPARAISRAASAAVSPEHGVRPAEARSHLAREHPSLAHSDVDGQREAASTMARTVRSIRSSSSPNV